MKVLLLPLEEVDQEVYKFLVVMLLVKDLVLMDAVYRSFCAYVKDI